MHDANVVVLTPVKDAADLAADYFERLGALTYPLDRIDVALLESDSRDGTYDAFCAAAAVARPRFRSIRLWKKDFGYRIPDGAPRWDPHYQVERRTILARSRNHLLMRGLGDADWALWLDADVIEYPADILERLLAYRKDIVHPHCVREYGGPTFDLNAWRDHGRLHLEDMRGEAELVPLDAVGGTMLLVRADRHRDGLIFPAYLHGRANPRVRPGNMHYPPRSEGEIETEGFGIMAADMGFTCWGVPGLEIRHHAR
jgi:hypothetical protein